MGYLAECYRDGVGIPSDPAEAAVWAQRGARAGDARSKKVLASLRERK